MADQANVDDRIARARRFGFNVRDVPEARFTAKDESHDDGPGHGMFLGAIGGPAFSRDLNGRFSRWHLHPGMHLVADVDAAFLAVRWVDGGATRSARLRRNEVETHEVAALHPMSHEVIGLRHAPFELVVTSFSPVIPGDEDASAGPVVVMDVHAVPLPGEHRLPPIDIALFWPNLNGWRASAVTSTDRGDVAWPGLHHAGNVNQESPLDTGVCVVQSRTSAAGTQPRQGVSVAVAGGTSEYSVQQQFRLTPMATGVPDEEQAYTLAGTYDAFVRTGRLGMTPDASWEAHWHEPVGSAVAAHIDGASGPARTRFVVAFDWPEVTFGMGRTWRRRYAARAATDCVGLARKALEAGDGWLASIDAWHESTLERLTRAGWSPSVAGCVVNELNLAVSLGTAWVDGSASSPQGPEHLGLLEGFDEGYFYYNTSDLWHYAFPAIGLNWPRLADLVVSDLGDALDREITDRRPIYRPAEPRPILVADKLPHDLGNPLEDPFVRVNGYSMRDDPNTWRDSNPAYVLATVVHHRMHGIELDARTWDRLQAAAEVTARQSGDNGSVPRHDEFGDSTWDNLGLRGYSTYTTGLCAGMWAVLAQEAVARGVDPSSYERRRDVSVEVLDELWTGRCFRAASEGKYVDAVMPDSLMGVFYADVAGVGDIVSEVRIREHLSTAYDFAHRANSGGAVGPLLIAEETLREYERDGGQELQVNEVLIGSAWLFTAMLARYGLAEQASTVADAIRNVLYGDSGLQFRSPAAVNADGKFRAPLNMRPLAAWWLAALAEH
ncbi:non-lysosomal glucosylceramidase [Nocardioidaceae bacterium SCSIO 66511]|nr:non-lysosomal glucosylceramidase [Nocardioidaceae bacterium SCSIO 66511]